MGPFLFAALSIAAQCEGCDPCCDGDTLHYCDGETATTLECAAVGGRCGVLTEEWGSDCILGEGQACDPGYAFGASRCDRAASLYCIDGACTQADGPEGEPVEEPTPGTEIPFEQGSTNPFGCPDCGDSNAAVVLPALALLRLRTLHRRRRRA